MICQGFLPTWEWQEQSQEFLQSVPTYYKIYTLISFVLGAREFFPWLSVNLSRKEERRYAFDTQRA